MSFILPNFGTSHKFFALSKKRFGLPQRSKALRTPVLDQHSSNTAPKSLFSAVCQLNSYLFGEILRSPVDED